MEHRRISVGGRGEAVELVAGERAEALQMRQQVRVELRLDVLLQQSGVRRIGMEQVDAAAVGQRGLRQRIGRLHYSRNEGSRRSSIRSSAGHSSSVIFLRLPGA